MIRRIARWLIGICFKRYRRPWKHGPVKIKDRVSHKHFTLMWRPDGYAETQIFRHGLYGSWERRSLLIWAHLSADVAEILDIGANTGIYSLLARTNNPHATIVAVEPIPINAAALESNIVANNANIIVERVALSDREGVGVMYMLEDRVNYMTAINHDRYALHPEIVGSSKVVPIQVPIATWSTVQGKYNVSNPQLIKIDVEGHEVEVLHTLYDHIRARRPTLLLEIMSSINASRINTMLDGLGYAFISIDEKSHSAVRVSSLWDNDHQNFLLCRPEIAQKLVARGLVRNAEERSY